MEITKHSETEIKIITPKEEIKSRESIKQEVIAAQASLDGFESWVLAERVARQAILVEKQALLLEATRVGVIDAKVEEVAEIIP